VRKTSGRFAFASRLVVRFAVSVILAGAIVRSGPADAAAKYAAVVIDANTGKTLFAASADAPRYPASLTKMMTLYLLFEGLKTGKFTKSTRIPVSRHAANQAPSKLGLKPGQSISVETAILALVTKSANDAAAASGEFIGGSEPRFAQMMTAKARRIGMSRTTFRNASGLPDPSQVTTARDMATLGMALRENFPQYYAYFSTRSFTYGRSRMGNHNKLLGRVAGVDGIKTGYTRASGFNLVTSVKQGNRQLVAVVMGGATGRARDQHMASLVKKYTSRASSRDPQPLLARFLNKRKKPVQEDVAVVEQDVAMATPVDEADVTEEVEVTAPTEKPVVKVAEPVLAFAAPKPVKRPKAIDAAEQIAEAHVAEAQEKVDPITTASNDPTGWVIQIAAAESEDGAFKLLSGAKSKAGKALAPAKPFTQMVQKGSSTLYRARFSGFESKEAAWNACASLKKQKISCFALIN
jgi:D-alanyl-D-alanine carboxypeptidase